jgi:hypothetical protein
MQVFGPKLQEGEITCLSAIQVRVTGPCHAKQAGGQTTEHPEAAAQVACVPGQAPPSAPPAPGPGGAPYPGC